MKNLTEQGDVRVPGCQSCLVKPSFKGILQLRNAGLFLTPDPPPTCNQESSDILRNLPSPLLRPLFEGLKKCRSYPSWVDGRCLSQFAITLKIDLSRFA